MWGQQSYRSTTLKQLFDNDDRFFGTRVKQYGSTRMAVGIKMEVQNDLHADPGRDQSYHSLLASFWQRVVAGNHM